MVEVFEDTEQIAHKKFSHGKFVIVCKNLTLDRFEHKLCNETIKQLGRQQYEIHRWLVRNIRPITKETVFTIQEYHDALSAFKEYLFRGYS